MAFCGIMTAFAIVLGYLEHLIPFSVGIYGIKLGLANLAILSLLYLADIKSALTVHVIRILLCGILFGNGVSLIYSAAGGLASFVCMVLLKKSRKFSAVGVSIAGGITHNLFQLGAAILLVENLRIALYLPVLLITGSLTGLLIGLFSLPVIRNKELQREK